MRRLALSLAVTLLVGAGALPAGAAGGLSIRGVDPEGFPEVAVTLSLEEAAELSPEDVIVREDGAPAEVGSLEPLQESGITVDVVLALDVSGSMRGEPLAAAVAAARRFVEGLPDDVGVGVLTFSDGARVRHEITSDRGAALRAIGSLSADGETALYDAVAAAAGMFAGDAQRNVVLLSDGGDTASTSGLSEAVRAAQGAEVSVFSVGLTTGEADVATLRRLSARTGGRYAPAGTADLSALYAGLARELSNQFLVTYESTSEPGAEVSVSVSVGGASDRSLVAFPSVAVPRPSEAVPEPQPVPQPEPLLEGVWGLGVTMGLTFLAVFSLSVLLFGTAARKRRERVLARRMAVQPKTDGRGPRGGTEDRRSTDWVSEPMVNVAERIASAGGFGERLERRLERAGAPLRVGEFTVGALMAGVLGGLVGAILFQRLLFVAVFALAGGVIPVIVLSITMNRRLNKLHAQLPDILMLLASSLRAGHSFFQALSTVAEEIGAPAGEELGRVVSEVRLGRPVDEALNALAERVGSDDFRWAVLAVNIQRDVGGNLAEVLDTVADTVREREVIRRQVRVLSAEGRLSAIVLTALPFAIGLYMSQVNPGYMTPLFTTRTGIMMLIVAGSLLGVGMLWIRRMVKIDV